MIRMRPFLSLQPQQNREELTQKQFEHKVSEAAAALAAAAKTTNTATHYRLVDKTTADTTSASLEVHEEPYRQPASSSTRHSILRPLPKPIRPSSVIIRDEFHSCHNLRSGTVEICQVSSPPSSSFSSSGLSSSRSSCPGSTISSSSSSSLSTVSSPPCVCSICRLGSRFCSVGRGLRHLDPARKRCVWANRGSPGGGPICRCCFREFAHISSLKAHTLRAHQTRVYHPCPKCAKGFAEKTSLNRHHRQVHDNTSLFECTRCSRYFNTDFQLAQHMRIHDYHESGAAAGGSKRAFKCEECGFLLTTKSNLKRHQMRRHASSS